MKKDLQLINLVKEVQFVMFFLMTSFIIKFLYN
jgi:hypothetical protein